jgi:DNA-binding MarR family transcriptional regulator
VRKAGLRCPRLRPRGRSPVAYARRSGLTRLVDRIEAAGLVRREPVVGDRRWVRVVLTDEGLRRHNEAFAGHWKVIQREFGERLTADQQNAVANALTGFWHQDNAEQPGE